MGAGHRQARAAPLIELARNGYEEPTAATLREASADFNELELRASTRPLPARARPSAAPLQAVARRARDARAGDRGVRRVGRRGLGSSGRGQSSSGSAGAAGWP